MQYSDAVGAPGGSRMTHDMREFPAKGNRSNYLNYITRKRVMNAPRT